MVSTISRAHCESGEPASSSILRSSVFRSPPILFFFNEAMDGGSRVIRPAVVSVRETPHLKDGSSDSARGVRIGDPRQIGQLGRRGQIHLGGVQDEFLPQQVARAVVGRRNGDHPLEALRQALRHSKSEKKSVTEVSDQPSNFVDIDVSLLGRHVFSILSIYFYSPTFWRDLVSELTLNC